MQNVTDEGNTGKQRVLIVALGNANGTSSHLFVELEGVISQSGFPCRRIAVGGPGASLFQRMLHVLQSNFKHIPDVIWSQVLIVHVPVAWSLPLLLLARVLGKKLVVFQWDIYPTTLGGQPFSANRLRLLMDRIERRIVKHADVTVLPSEDFRAESTAARVVVFPLWPQRALTFLPIAPVPIEDGVIHIAFAGQINELRGLDQCAAHLRAVAREKFVLHLFSSDAFQAPSGSGNLLRVEQHGHLPRTELQQMLRTMHFGLISLNPRMDQPGFPSKTFDYLSAGLPILYFGRSLPAFTGQLERFGVGIDLTTDHQINLETVYARLISQLEAGRLAHFEFCSLNPQRIAAILQTQTTQD